MNNELENMLNGTKPVNSNRDLRSKVLATAASSWNDIEESLSNCLPPTAPRELREATLDRARQEWKQPILQVGISLHAFHSVLSASTIT